MFLGKVIGTVWSTVKWPGVSGLKLLVVRPYHLSDLPAGTAPDSLPAAGKAPAAAEPAGASRPEPSANCEAVVCVDLLDAGIGDDVVVAFGHAARVAAEYPGPGPGPGPAYKDKVQGESGRGSGPGLKGQNAPVVPIDAAVVAIVDSVAVTRPST